MRGKGQGLLKRIRQKRVAKQEELASLWRRSPELTYVARGSTRKYISFRIQGRKYLHVQAQTFNVEGELARYFRFSCEECNETPC